MVERVGRNPNAIAQEKGIFGLLDEAPGEDKRTGAYNAGSGDAFPTSNKHSLPADNNKARRKDRAQQLKSVSGPFDFLFRDRLIGFKRTTSIFEMRFVAMIRKNCQREYERGAKCNQRDSNWFP